MSYYTKHDLVVYKKNKIDIAYDELESFVEKIENEFNCTLSQPCKWYSMNEDMISFSKKHPEFYFYFRTWGEEPDDINVYVFNNGLSYYKQIEPNFPDIKNITLT